MLFGQMLFGQTILGKMTQTPLTTHKNVLLNRCSNNSKAQQPQVKGRIEKSFKIYFKKCVACPQEDFLFKSHR
jgi:hypothetical protein